MPLQGAKHVYGFLKIKVPGVECTLYGGRDYSVFLVIGYGKVVNVMDSLQNLHTYVFYS
jgi:hypothetical protein